MQILPKEAYGKTQKVLLRMKHMHEKGLRKNTA